MATRPLSVRVVQPCRFRLATPRSAVSAPNPSSMKVTCRQPSKLRALHRRKLEGFVLLAYDALYALSPEKVQGGALNAL